MTATPPNPAASAPPASLTALVADATAVGRQLAVFLLEKRGHRVEAFGATAELLARQKGAPADLILLDLHLTDPDALEAALSIRSGQKPTARATRLFALSPTPRDDLPRCRAAGFDGVLATPLDPKSLDELLARQAAPVVDAVELLNRLGGNRTLLRQMNDVLCQSMAAWDRDLNAAIEAGDAEQVRRTAHQMKGALGNLAARRAASAAKALEELGKSGNLTAIEPARTHLWSELARVQSELAAIAK